jgi:hypothetical protein
MKWLIGNRYLQIEGTRKYGENDVHVFRLAPVAVPISEPIDLEQMGTDLAEIDAWSLDELIAYSGVA